MVILYRNYNDYSPLCRDNLSAVGVVAASRLTEGCYSRWRSSSSRGARAVLAADRYDIESNVGGV